MAPSKKQEINGIMTGKVVGVIISEIYRMFAARDKKLDAIQNSLNKHKEQLDRIEEEVNFIKQDTRESKIKRSKN